MKKLLLFLIASIPVLIIVIVNTTVSIVSGYVSIPVDNISFKYETRVVSIDDNVTLEPLFYPEFATNQEVLWSSSDEDVLIVDSLGNIKFKAFGYAYATATTVDGGKSASTYFVVTDTKVHQLILFSKQNIVEVGQTLQIYNQILPTEAVNKNVTYTVSNPDIASIDENGLLTAKSQGNVSIIGKAEDNGFLASLEVTVTIPVENIIVNNVEVFCEQSYYQIPYIIEPSNATNKSVIFSCSDIDIATVNTNGKVVFNKAGTVNISIKTLDGDFTTSVSITFTDGYIKDINLSSPSIHANVSDQDYKIMYSTIPSSLYNTSIEFKSSNENVATVNEDGIVSFVGGGNCNITIYANSSENKIYSKTFFVFVERDADDISVINNAVIGSKTYQINCSSLPLDSTNTNFYYNVVSDIASVDNNGLVTFTAKGVVNVEIIANNPTSSVRKYIRIECTDGYPNEMIVQDNINLNYGEQLLLNVDFLPLDTVKKELIFTVVSNDSNDNLGNTVITCNEFGLITAIRGGTAILNIQAKTDNNTYIEKNVNVTVYRPIESITIELDLDYFEQKYVTAISSVNYNVKILPLDSTNKNYEIILSDTNLASCHDNLILFNYAGTLQIEATNKIDNVSSSTSIVYTGGTLVNVEFNEIPKKIFVGESISVSFKSYIPSNIPLANIVLLKTNEIMLGNEQVALIDGTSIVGLNGGTVTINIYVASVFKSKIDIEVVRKASSINTTPKNTTITNSSIELLTNVLPQDTSNKEIMYSVDNTDIANIFDSTLVFNQVGKVTITARTTDNSNIVETFTLEYIKDSIENTVISSEIDLYLGGHVQLETDNTIINYTDQIIEEIENDGVVEFNNLGIITPLKCGIAKLKYSFFNNNNLVEIKEIKITVYNKIEQITITNFDEMSGELITGEDENILEVSYFPTTNVNAKFNYSTSDTATAKVIDGKLNFYKVGVVTLTIISEDENVIRNYRVRYTGGDAIKVELNTQNDIKLNINDVLEIKANNWLPKNITNKNLSILEVSDGVSQLNEIIEIDGSKITAKKGGKTRVIVYASSNLTEYINITVIQNIEKIEFEHSELITANSQVLINPIIYPQNATEKNVEYSLSNNEIASIKDNILKFNTFGTVTLKVVSSKDNTISASIDITSTFGFPSSITLNHSSYALNIGQSFNLSVTLYSPIDTPNQILNYEIINNLAVDGSDDKIVSVHNGIVTALKSGSCIVRISVSTLNGIVYSDCFVNVESTIEKIELQFENELESVYGTYVTSKAEHEFKINYYPVYTTQTEYEISIGDEEKNIAKIENNKLIFLTEGMISLTITSKNNSNIYNRIYINYIGDTCLNAEFLDDDVYLDELGNKAIDLEVGDTYEFAIKNTLPNDLSNYKVTFTKVTETRISSLLAPTVVINDIVHARNGGSVIYTVFVNGFAVGNYKFNVLRKAQAISITETDIITSSENYQINCSIIPEDTNNKELTYEIDNSEIATVSPSGFVQFSKIGKVQVTIKNEFSNLSKTISINYTKDLVRIYFSETKTEMLINEILTLNVNKVPFDAPDTEYVFESSDENVATISNSGKILTNANGYFTITCYSKTNPNIKTSRDFVVSSFVTNIALELDSINDNLGIGGYRVFGNTFYNSKNTVPTIDDEITNNYQMKVLSVSPAGINEKLVWSSSNVEIATVNDKGLVTFVGAGSVTISVAPEKQYNALRPVYDSYTFKVLNAINVYDYVGFEYAMDKNLACVIQEDLVLMKDKLEETSTTLVNKGRAIRSNIHGNGHLINMGELYGEWSLFVIDAFDVVVDNVNLRGMNFVEGTALSSFNNLFKLISISAPNTLDNTKQVLIKNSILENYGTIIEVLNSRVKVDGCILRNSYLANIQLTHFEDVTKKVHVTVKDSSLGNSLLSCIMNNFDQTKDDVTYTQLIFEGDVRMSNFRTASEMKGSKIEEYFDMSLLESALQILDQYPEIKYVYNGQDYYNLCILSCDVDYFAGSFSSKIDINFGNIKQPNPYKKHTVRAVLVAIKCSINLYCTENTNTEYTPETTTTIADYVWLRQPF